MKKLFMGAIALSCFSISLTLVQMSCSKSTAQVTGNNLSQLNKIIFIKEKASGDNEIWTANYDGTNQTQIPIALPATVKISGDVAAASVKLSPDGQTIFFVAFDNTSTIGNVYSCNISGNNVQLIVDHSSDVIRLGGAY